MKNFERNLFHCPIHIMMIQTMNEQLTSTFIPCPSNIAVCGLSVGMYR